MPLGFTRLQAYGNRPAINPADPKSPPNLQITQADAVHFSGNQSEPERAQSRLFNPRRLFSRLWNAITTRLHWLLARFGLEFGQKERVEPIPLHPQDRAHSSSDGTTGQPVGADTGPETSAPVPQTRDVATQTLPTDVAESPLITSVTGRPDFIRMRDRHHVKFNPFSEPPAQRLLYPGIKEVRNEPQLFWNAVMAGDVVQARHYIERGIDVNVRQVDGATPLHDAASRGNLPMVLLLLDAPDIQPNFKDQRGTRPIHKAVIENHPDVVAALLKKNVKIEADSWYENKPLQSAANLGHAEIVKLLLQHGAKVNAQSWQGYTPLYWAAEHGHLAVVRDLLAHGAKVTIANNYGETALHGAARGGHAEVMEALLAAEGADPNAPDQLGETPLHRAAARDNLEVLEKLKAKGGDMHLPAQNGETPQHILDKRRLIRAEKGHS